MKEQIELQANTGKAAFARRVARVIQVLYRRGLLKEGMAFMPGNLKESSFLHKSRKPISMSAAQWPTAKAKPENLPGEADLARRLRLAFEDLGPTFIKLGQILSIRPDIVSQEVVNELSLLLDQVKPLPTAWVEHLISTELGALPGQLFVDFDYAPLASASIAQVHRATLKSGEEVVLKIQRPRLAEEIKQDIGVLQFLQPLLQRSTIGKVCDISQVVDAFSRQIKNELDFTVEALNLQSFAQVLEPKHQILVPGIHWSYTTKRVLTLDYMEGAKLEAYLGSAPSLAQRKNLSKKLVVAVLEPFFQHGVFHGDPHPGNLLVSDSGQLVLLDYGIVGRLDQEFRFQAALLLASLKNFDTMAMVGVICTLGDVTKPLNNYLLYEDASQLMQVVRGVNRGEVAFSKVVYGMIEMAINHGIHLPSSFYLFGKALVTTESVVGQINGEINLVDEIYVLAKDYLQQEFKLDSHQDKLLLASLTALREQRHLPERMASLLANICQGKQQLVFSHQGLEPVASAIRESGRKTSSGLVILGLLTGSAIIASFGPPGLQIYLAGAGAGLAGWLLVKNFR